MRFFGAIEAEPGKASSYAPRIIAEDVIVQPGNKDVGRDQFEEINVNPIKLVSEEPVSTFSVDVDTASYAFVRRQLNNGVLPQKNSIRIEELINYFDYNYPLPQDKTKPFEPTVAVYPCPWNPNTQLLHIGIKGYDIAPEVKPRSNLVFLLDVSGSMNSSDKLPLLKNSMKMLVEHLDPNDTVAIAVYAGAAGTVLEPTKVQEKSKIIAALERLQAGGSTAGAAGIKLAYSLAQQNFDKEAVNRVILATDGDFNVGITNREELKSFIERKRESGIFLSILGFGQGNYNDALMQTLAQNGNGNAAYIDSLNEARKVLVDEASSTLFPIAKDVKIQIEFNPAVVNDYRLIGYETRMLKREDFNNDKVDAAEIGSGHTVTAIYEITPVDAREKLIDPLRYQTAKEKAAAPKTTEIGFLKIRYKLPDSNTSTLITKKIDDSLKIAEFDSIDTEMRFAAAVAGFGQLLRQDPYTQNFSYKDIIAMAMAAKGVDEFGYRSEFINLVRLANSTKSQM
jgi:Ca-activated chloride channel family protein